VLIYIGMGWIVIFALPQFARAVGAAGLGLLLFGGLFYTGGVVFYRWKSLPYNHAIWHLFVLGGSVCHFTAVLWCVALPRGA
jgi:hemolysin III